MKSYYAVVDTNVLVSALFNNDSVPGKVVRAIFDKKIIPLYSSEIFSEYSEVLNRDKFKFKSEDIEKILKGITTFGKETPKADLSEINETFPDPKDIVFYQVVMEGKKTDESYLVTGNTKHFPIKPFIVTPKEMLDLIDGE